ncbi:MAG: tetratricopeptide repeat protein [Nitrospinota bacterium]
METYENLLLQVPSYSDARRNLATTYLDIENFDQALKNLKILIDENPNDEMLLGFFKYAKEMSLSAK